MSFADFVKAALELGVIPAIAIFLIFGLFLQNRRLLADQRRLLEKFAEVVLRAQVLQGQDTSQLQLPEANKASESIPPALPSAESVAPTSPETHKETGKGVLPATPPPTATPAPKTKPQYHRQVRTSDQSTAETLVLQPRGKITIGGGDIALREAVQKALEGGWHKIVLDLNQVTTMDSSGIGELVSVYTTVSSRGGHLVLSRPPDKVREILNITQLISVFEIYDTVEAAIEALG